MKSILITGATDGIGKAAALKLAKNKNKVVLTGRNKEKLEKTLHEVRKKSNNENVFSLLADFASLKDVHNLANQIIQKFPDLNILINNAGVVKNNYELTKDGFEYQLSVNYLAPFLLTYLLKDLLINNAPSRIINVTSQVHKGAEINFDDFNFERATYSPTRTYAITKLQDLMFTYKLSRELSDKGVTVNCLHPGVVATNLLSDYRNRPRATNLLARFTNDAPEDGAKTIVYLAESEEVENVSGKYFVDCKPEETSLYSYNKDFQEKLWNVTLDVLGIIKRKLNIN